MNKPKKEHLEQGQQALVATAGAINPILGGIIGVAAALFGPALIRPAGRVDDILKEIKDRADLFTPLVAWERAISRWRRTLHRAVHTRTQRRQTRNYASNFRRICQAYNPWYYVLKFKRSHVTN